MPEYHREKITHKTQIAVWKITESEAELLNGLALSKHAIDRLSKRKSETHRKGYLAIRQLLKSFEIDPIAHQYDEHGAPYLTDGRHLSITHTKDIAAIAISSVPVGIDLEHYQEKIKKIGPRFLHKKEMTNPKKREEILPTGFIVGLKNIYLSTNIGRLLVIDIKSGKTISTLKIDKDKISRPFVSNQNLYLAKDNAIIKLN